MAFVTPGARRSPTSASGRARSPRPRTRSTTSGESSTSASTTSSAIHPSPSRSSSSAASSSRKQFTVTANVTLNDVEEERTMCFTIEKADLPRYPDAECGGRRRDDGRDRRGPVDHHGHRQDQQRALPRPRSRGLVGRGGVGGDNAGTTPGSSHIPSRGTAGAGFFLAPVVLPPPRRPRHGRSAGLLRAVTAAVFSLPLVEVGSCPTAGRSCGRPRARSRERQPGPLPAGR